MNLIPVSFSGRLHTAEASTTLWQWDYGQKLTIHGLNLPSVYEVHFCNPGDAETILQLGDWSGVNIPDECLTSGKNVFAFIYLHDGSEDGETVYKITVKVNPRPKPTDRTPSETQRDALNDVINAINSYLASGGGGGSSATANYQQLINRPRINGHTLTGNMTGEELGLVEAEEGKGLSTNDYTTDEQTTVALVRAIMELSNQNKLVTITDEGAFGVKDINDLGFEKSVEGKGLSQNDYTDAHKSIVQLLASFEDAINNGKIVGVDGGVLKLMTVETGGTELPEDAAELIALLKSLANIANNGKTIGVRNGTFAAVDAPSLPEWTGGRF